MISIPFLTVIHDSGSVRIKKGVNFVLCYLREEREKTVSATGVFCVCVGGGGGGGGELIVCLFFVCFVSVLRGGGGFFCVCVLQISTVWGLF